MNFDIDTPAATQQPDIPQQLIQDVARLQNAIHELTVPSETQRSMAEYEAIAHLGQAMLHMMRAYDALRAEQIIDMPKASESIEKPATAATPEFIEPDISLPDDNQEITSRIEVASDAEVGDTIERDGIMHTLVEWKTKDGLERDYVPEGLAKAVIEQNSENESLTPYREHIVEHIGQQAITEVDAPSQDTELQEVESAEDAQPESADIPEPATEALETDDAENGLSLTKRERVMWELIKFGGSKDEWFARSAIDFSSVNFASEHAHSQAFSALTAKLVAAGALEAKGARGGRRYRLPKEESELSERAQQIIADAEASSARMAKEDQKAASEFASTVIPASTDTLKTSAAPQMTLQERSRQIRAMEYAQDLVDAVEVYSFDSDLVTEVTAQLAKDLDVPIPEASGLLASLVAKKHFEIKQMNGRRVLRKLEPQLESEVIVEKAVEAPTKAVSKQKASSPKSVEAKADRNTLTLQDIEWSKGIFGLLLEKKHVQQGIEPNVFIRQLGIHNEDVTAFRAALRKLHKHGYLEFNKDANTNTRSSRSKRISTPVYMFKNQELKDRIKTDTAAVFDEMQQLVVDVDA